jgi:hypothetical protein
MIGRVTRPIIRRMSAATCGSTKKAPDIALLIRTTVAKLA